MITVRERLQQLGIAELSDDGTGGFIIGSENRFYVFEGPDLDRLIDSAKPFTLAGVYRPSPADELQPCRLLVRPDGSYAVERAEE